MTPAGYQSPGFGYMASGYTHTPENYFNEHYEALTAHRAYGSGADTYFAANHNYPEPPESTPTTPSATLAAESENHFNDEFESFHGSPGFLAYDFSLGDSNEPET
jgi:hypothetical protein